MAGECKFRPPEGDIRVKVCGPMRQLREELDRRGVEWEDCSSEFVSPQHVLHCEQTIWTHDGHKVSVVWHYGEMPTVGRYGLTYGWPDMLECWPNVGDGEPEAMTVDEILARCCDD